MANSVDPDQPAPIGAVCSGPSCLLALTDLLNASTESTLYQQFSSKASKR